MKLRSFGMCYVCRTSVWGYQLRAARPYATSGKTRLAWTENVKGVMLVRHSTCDPATTVARQPYRKEKPMAPKNAPAEPEGMFRKDKEIGNRIDGQFEIGEPFILFDAAVAPELVDTAIGKARKTLLEVAALDSPDERIACVTLASAIADKAEQATPEDFPAVVELRKVKSTKGSQDALVIQYVRDYVEK